MSREIRLIKCSKCGKILYKKESGEGKNSNTRRFIISESKCPYCMEQKK